MHVHIKRDVVQWIRDEKGDPTWANRLRAHRTKLVETANHGYVYYRPSAPDGDIVKETYRGVTTAMKQCLYHVTGRSAPAGRISHYPEERTEGPSRNPYLNKRGADLGSLIAEQAFAYIVDSHRAFKQRFPHGLHPRTRVFYHKLTTWRSHPLMPLANEFKIYHRALGLATRLDLVAVDRRGRLWFFEMKTNKLREFFEGYRSRSAQFVWSELLEAFRVLDWPCTPYHLAKVQLALGVWMVCAAHGRLGCADLPRRR